MPDSGRNGQTHWEEPQRHRVEDNAAVVVSLFLLINAEVSRLSEEESRWEV